MLYPLSYVGSLLTVGSLAHVVLGGWRLPWGLWSVGGFWLVGCGWLCTWTGLLGLPLSCLCMGIRTMPPFGMGLSSSCGGGFGLFGMTCGGVGSRELLGGGMGT